MSRKVSAQINADHQPRLGEEARIVSRLIEMRVPAVAVAAESSHRAARTHCRQVLCFCFRDAAHVT
jgi:hypothetical protein